MLWIKGGAGKKEGRERGRESACDCIVCRYGHEWVHKHTKAHVYICMYMQSTTECTLHSSPWIMSHDCHMTQFSPDHHIPILYIVTTVTSSPLSHHHLCGIHVHVHVIHVQ